MAEMDSEASEPEDLVRSPKSDAAFSTKETVAPLIDMAHQDQMGFLAYLLDQAVEDAQRQSYRK